MQELMAKAMTFANRGKGIAQQAETLQAAESMSFYRGGQETVTNRGVVPFVISHRIKPSWWRRREVWSRLLARINPIRGWPHLPEWAK